MSNTTIAVLPFVNMSSNPDNEYFSDGITEEIINALARIKELKVTSRTSSFFFKDKKIPLKEVAEELGVAIVLEGSIRLAGNKVRITAQLIQAKNDFHFWSETWDRKLENIFEIQDEVSLHIADRIREQFGHLEFSDHLVDKQTDNLDAYAFSLKAKYHFNKWNPEDVRISIDLFEKAIALDSNHTESYVGLADAYGFMATTEFMPREEAWEKAVGYTQKAYALNPKNAGVHYQLANIAFFTASDFQESMQHALKAAELKPSYPEAQQYIAFLYILIGEMDKANAHLQVALSIDPLSQETLFYKAYYHYRLRDYKEALRILNSCLEKNPKNIPAYIVRSYCLLKLKKFDELHKYLAHMPKDIVIPDEQLGISCLAYILSGDKSNADKYFALLKKESEKPTSFQAHSYLYLAYVCMNKFDKAYSWLDEVIKMKSSVLLLTFADPLAENLPIDSKYNSYKTKLFNQVTIQEETATKKPPLLDAETAEAYKSRLLQFIEEEEPYLSPNLTLRLLAEQVEIHPNQLSWLLNERLGKNFNDFINYYRVERFKSLVTNPSNSHISLIGLAYESGFNSKTVFNTFFKKEVGMTPKEYMKANS